MCHGIGHGWTRLCLLAIALRCAVTCALVYHVCTSLARTHTRSVSCAVKVGAIARAVLVGLSLRWSHPPCMLYHQFGVSSCARLTARCFSTASESEPPPRHPVALACVAARAIGRCAVCMHTCRRGAVVCCYSSCIAPACPAAVVLPDSVSSGAHACRALHTHGVGSRVVATGRRAH